MNAEQQKKYTQLYHDYLYAIKPLIAEIEAVYEKFPISILNEIRAFHDHVARCFKQDAKEEDIDIQISKAQSHNERILLDCYKYLNVWYHDAVNKFEEQFMHVDLTLIDNGQYLKNYNVMKEDAIILTRYAKSNEHKLDDETFVNYQNSYIKWIEVHTYLFNNIDKITWAQNRLKKSKKLTRIITAALWIISLMATIFIGSILTNNNKEIVDVFLRLINK